MDKNRVIGAGKQIAGSIKQAIGRTVGDRKLQVEGRAERVEGKVQNAVGGLKDTCGPRRRDSSQFDDGNGDRTWAQS